MITSSNTVGQTCGLDRNENVAGSTARSKRGAISERPTPCRSCSRRTRRPLVFVRAARDGVGPWGGEGKSLAPSHPIRYPESEIGRCLSHYRLQLAASAVPQVGPWTEWHCQLLLREFGSRPNVSRSSRTTSRFSADPWVCSSSRQKLARSCMNCLFPLHGLPQ